MKILFIIPAMKCGGAERVAVTFAKCLTEHEVKFVNLGSAEDELSSWIEPNFPIISLNCRRSFGAYFPLKRLIRKENPDFIFTTHIYVSVILMLTGKKNTRKLIARFPTMPSNKLYKGLKIRIMEALERKLFRNTHTIIAQTDEMKKEICSLLNVNEENVVTIHNPIDMELIDKQTADIATPFDKSKVNYLSVGNISPAKGYDTLITAFKLVLEKNSDAQLYILGRKETEYAQQIISTAKDSPNIHFEGFCKNPYQYMKYCTALVLSSRMEGLPNVVLEAMYLNRPVAATTCVPIIDNLIKDGVNGYKSQPDNAESLASAMQKATLLQDIRNENLNETSIIEFKKIFEKK